jgi:hypothetical protein
MRSRRQLLCVVALVLSLFPARVSCQNQSSSQSDASSASSSAKAQPSQEKAKDKDKVPRGSVENRPSGVTSKPANGVAQDVILIYPAFS